MYITELQGFGYVHYRAAGIWILPAGRGPHADTDARGSSTSVWGRPGNTHFTAVRVCSHIHDSQMVRCFLILRLL